MPRSRTRVRPASFPAKSTEPGPAAPSPPITRRSVVLPEPEGPSSATSSPESIRTETLSSPTTLPQRLQTSRTSMLMVPPFGGDSPFDDLPCDERHDADEREEGGHREGADLVVLVVENLDVERHRVRAAAHVTRDHRDRTELAGSACRAD